jgi:hypothetical protein
MTRNFFLQLLLLEMPMIERCEKEAECVDVVV